jgi:hypothetical protein
MLIRLTGFPLKTCGNDKQKQPFKIVILGLDTGIQGISNLNTKDPKYLLTATLLVISVTLVLPFISVGRKLFGFTALPLSFLILMGVIIASYIISAEVAKKVFYKKVRF